MISKNDYDVLIKCKNGEISSSNGIFPSRILNLERLGLIEGAEYSSNEYQIFPTAYGITNAGEDALLDFELVEKERIANNKTIATTRTAAIIGIIIQIVGFVIDHFSGIVEIFSFLR